MTLTEYLNQENPQRLTSGTVILDDNEVEIIRRVKRKNVFSYTLVYVPAVGYCYMIIEGESKTLRGMDEDGNPKRWSVFSYNVPKED